MAAKRKTTAKKKTATKKSTTRKSVTTKNKSAAAKVESEKWWEQYSLSRSEWIRRGLIFAVLVYAVINYRGLVVAATVNGEPVSRLKVVSQLESTSGKATLDNIINETLIKQKARDAHITVTQEDIDAAIADIEANVLGQGQSIDEVLALQGMTREDLEKQLVTQVMVEKLLEGDAVATDEEVNAYVEQNRESITDEYSEEDLRNFAREQIRQQKLSQRFSTWIQELREDANINYLVDY